MINEIYLKNFKCFEEIRLPLKNVNIFTGINGMGKSTIIQSLLLLRQSWQKPNDIEGLKLNGKYLKLGNGQDILYEKAVDEIIEISYSTEDEAHDFQFQYIPDSDFLPVLNSEIIEGVDIFGNDFIYLSAYRVEPQELYRATNEENIKTREFGNNGEFSFQYLSLFGERDLQNTTVILEDKLGNSLNNQTRIWMDKISPGVSPQINLNLQLRTSEVRYEFIEGRNKTNSYKSVNVGFGITYVLPVVITLLSAKAGDTIILENPEAHIHPAGQRTLGELIARAGAGGVQVIVETHSDHILNGIRIAAKKRKIHPEDVNLLFFHKDSSDEYKHAVIMPKLDRDGRIDVWPEGFFDEWDNALLELL